MRSPLAPDQGALLRLLLAAALLGVVWLVVAWALA
jgi:hypothetical protein